jgi:hypothetical protein
MFKPTSKPTTEKSVAPQTAASRAAIAMPVVTVEYDTTNAAWVAFDAGLTSQLESLEANFRALATPLSLSKKFSDERR